MSRPALTFGVTFIYASADDTSDIRPLRRKYRCPHFSRTPLGRRRSSYGRGSDPNWKWVLPLSPGLRTCLPDGVLILPCSRVHRFLPTWLVSHWSTYKHKQPTNNLKIAVTKLCAPASRQVGAASAVYWVGPLLVDTAIFALTFRKARQYARSTEVSA